ncbi:MAG: transpeptidase family protein [Bacteroidaceae bacterium]|nr:transpeptidase family protein [Bacteroidaceae bacterium]
MGTKKKNSKGAKNQGSVMRYFIIAFLVLLLGVSIIFKAAKIMTVEKGSWDTISRLYKATNITITPQRGNIYAEDGQVLATSLPTYKMYMDFMAAKETTEEKTQRAQVVRDSTLRANLNKICAELNRLFPDQSAAEFRRRFEKGLEKHSRHMCLYNNRISYNQNREVMKLPIFRESQNKSGYCPEVQQERKHPFGSLLERSLGEMYAGKDTAKCGIELAYDTLLRGIPGIGRREKVLNTYQTFIDREPVNGYDIHTSIDVSLQDFCEKAIKEKMAEINGYVGVVIVMETKTGNIKAIVNMEECGDGAYRERKNHAISDLMEPGSTFKTASMMVALDDGVIDVNDSVDTGCGIYLMHGSKMKDHNWTKGGYQWLKVPEILWVSSNIGVSRIIDEKYGKNPQKFVDGLNRVGIGYPLNFPLAGSSNPRIKSPKSSSWSKTALAWMSIGYETQVPPISTLTFYNAIANGGKMIKPRLVTSYSYEGETIYEYPTEVLIDKICKTSTLEKIKKILYGVVNQKKNARGVGGLGKPAGSETFGVAGKTGTAQVATGGSYTGERRYLVSFCGFFPYENPKYTAIVAIQKRGLPASGGAQAGSVFGLIAKRIMASEAESNQKLSNDNEYLFTPVTKNGDISAAQNVLQELGLGKFCKGWSGTSTSPQWGCVENDNRQIKFTCHSPQKNIMPNIIGMGARDAVFILESLGLKVRLSGTGKVAEQSISAGTKIERGTSVSIKLNTQANKAKS